MAHTIFCGGAHTIFFEVAHPAPPHPKPPKTNILPHMAIEGVLTRQKCAETPPATFWDPVPPDLVAPNCDILFFMIFVVIVR